MNAPRYGVQKAFSLVEVVVALGLVSFVILALLGLLSVGMKSSRQAEEETRIAGMGSSVLAFLRNAKSLPVGGTNFLFDSDGNETVNGATAFYDCAATFRIPAESELPGIGTNAYVVVLRFSWPANLEASPHSSTLCSAVSQP